MTLLLLDLFVEIAVPIIICFLAYPIVKCFVIKNDDDRANAIVSSFILSMTFLLLLPYCVVIVFGGAFQIASYALFLVGLLSITIIARNQTLKISGLFNNLKNRIHCQF